MDDSRKKKVDTKRNFLSCGVIRKTTESSTVLLQQLKFNNGVADKILGLLLKKPTADVGRLLLTRRERRSLKPESSGKAWRADRKKIRIAGSSKEPKRCFQSNGRLLSLSISLRRVCMIPTFTVAIFQTTYPIHLQ